MPERLNQRVHPPEVREAFIEWLAVPRDIRTPRTLAEWCHEHGLDRVTTWRWRQEPGFSKEVIERVRLEALGHLPDLIGVCIEKAKGGSAKHLEMLMRHVFGFWARVGEDDRRAVEDNRTRFQQALEIIQSGRLGEQLAAITRAAQESEARRIEPVDVSQVEADEPPE